MPTLPEKQNEIQMDRVTHWIYLRKVAEKLFGGRKLSFKLMFNIQNIIGLEKSQKNANCHLNLWPGLAQHVSWRLADFRALLVRMTFCVASLKLRASLITVT